MKMLENPVTSCDTYKAHMPGKHHGRAMAMPQPVIPNSTGSRSPKRSAILPAEMEKNMGSKA
ncbi:hypothetical protein D3C75_1046430 [compost metagenome]